jgi:serine/threonine protein phosphatase PrpC
MSSGAPARALDHHARAAADSAAAPDAVRAAGATDPGRVRDQNEDRFHLDVERGIFLVVDGVGGHAAGEVAATVARDVIVERLEQNMWSAEQRVREAIALANNEVLRRASAAPDQAGMTCVVTVAVLAAGRVTIGHVGDSRLYLLSEESIHKLTHDHSPIGEREDAQEISEAEAMRHPRRNEVFRDVGSAYHEPDDPDFVEVVEAPFSPNQAMLLCSDGLSDLLTSEAIARTIRRHAGDPPAVARALIDAANEAGGTDNVTVVYAEGSRFATASAERSVLAGSGSGSDAGAVHRLLSSRVLWFTLGALAGVALTLGLLQFDRGTPTAVADGRRLVVGGTGPESYSTIAAAIAAAQPRDVIEVEPGEYTEAVVLPSGVNLAARVPGSVVLVAPPGREGWVGVTADVAANRISGLRISGRPGAPMAVGIRLAGHQLVVDDVTIEGLVGVAVDVQNDGDVLVRGSRFADLQGLSIRTSAGAKPSVRRNVFARGVAASRPALEVGAGTAPLLVDNVFAGYKETEIVEPVPPAPASAAISPVRELLQRNFVIGGQNHGR